MRDDDDRAFIIRQKALQPLNGVNIQMVGWLIEKQDFRTAEQRLRQHNFDLFGIRAVAHRPIQNIVGVQAETLKQLGGVAVGIPAVQLGKLAFQLGGAVAVLLRKRILGIQGILFLHDLIQARITLNDGVQNGKFVKREVILPQDGHAQIWRHLDRTGGWLQITGQHTQECGLTGTVRANDTIAVAGGEF